MVNFLEIIKEVLLSEAMLNIYAMALGIILTWLFNKYIHTPAARNIAYEVAKAIEKQAPEGTPLDTFLDEFVKRFNTELGRDPSAGELKTALDIKNKTISLKFNKEF